MTGSNVELVVVLEKDWPLRGVDCWGEILGLDEEISVVLGLWIVGVGVVLEGFVVVYLCLALLLLLL